MEEKHGHEGLEALELRWCVVKKSNNSSVVTSYYILVIGYQCIVFFPFETDVPGYHCLEFEL